MILSIVIPAYNEQEAIEDICQRTLDARASILDKTKVKEVEIIVVSDGSDDMTVQKARRFEEIKLISYEKNRGYGAALKTGFSSAKGDLVSFLDADGTCDPLFFVDLVNLLEEKNADVAMGSRLGEQSEMPLIRRVGNYFFRSLINFMAHVNITDSASGMRVIRRDALEMLYPLPDGLHFTPAMSCRAVLDPRLSIVEKPMAYKERIGRSKLGVVRDGFRFLAVILEIALTYKPFSFFSYMATILMIVALGYGIGPCLFYLKNAYIAEWMIFRIVTVSVLGTIGLNLYAIGIIAQRVTALFNPYENSRVKPTMILMEKLIFRRPVVTGVCFFLLALVVNRDLIVQYLSTGEIASHWIFPITGAFLVLLGAQFISFAIMDIIIERLKEKQNLLQGRSHAG